MVDPFKSYADDVHAPSRSVLAVVPHDSNELPILPKALYIGVGGNVTLRAADDSADVVFQNVAAGSILRVRARFVRAAGTTASAILAHC